MSEFRKHGRYNVSNAMTLTHDRIGQWTAFTRDMSETGMFVNCPTLACSLQPGEKIDAIIQMQNQTISTVVRVVRVSHDGVGFTYD